MAISRRGLLGALIAAPAIVRASSLMPIKVYDNTAAVMTLLERRIAEAQESILRNLYGDIWYQVESQSGLPSILTTVRDAPIAPRLSGVFDQVLLKPLSLRPQCRLITGDDGSALTPASVEELGVK